MSKRKTACSPPAKQILSSAGQAGSQLPLIPKPASADELIDAFIALPDIDTFVRDAASTMSGPGSSDAIRAVETAATIRHEAQNNLAHRRRQLLNEMDDTTLAELASRLGLDAADNSEWKKPHPPAAVAVLRELDRRFLEPCLDRSIPTPACLLEQALTEARVTRPDLPDPDLPCTLVEALRYVTGDQRAEPAIIESAFRDWVVGGAKAPLRHGHEDWKSQLTARRQRVAELIREDCFDAEYKQELMSEAALLKEQIVEFEKTRKFWDKWLPGKEIPGEFATGAEDIVDYYWPEDEVTEQGIAELLRADFIGFWNIYKRRYAAIHNPTSKSSPLSRRKATDIGERGLSTRLKAQWLTRVADFVEYWKQHERPRPATCAFEYCLQCYAKDAVKDIRTRRKIEGFIKTLLQHLIQPRGASRSLDRLLKAAGIKFTNLELIDGCLHILAEVVGKSTESPAATSTPKPRTGSKAVHTKAHEQNQSR